MLCFVATPGLGSSTRPFKVVDGSVAIVAVTPVTERGASSDHPHLVDMQRDVMDFASLPGL